MNKQIALLNKILAQEELSLLLCSKICLPLPASSSIKNIYALTYNQRGAPIWTEQLCKLKIIFEKKKIYKFK
jgi:hypothetical protein